MHNTAKIEKITLSIGGEQIELSIEQAKELQKLLNETFQKEVVLNEIRIFEIQKEWVPTPMPYPYPTPTLPLQPYYVQPPIVYCSTNNSLNLSIT